MACKEGVCSISRPKKVLSEGSDGFTQYELGCSDTAELLTESFRNDMKNVTENFQRDFKHRLIYSFELGFFFGIVLSAITYLLK